MHPEESLTLDQAIALLNNQSVIAAMLLEIPGQQLALVP